MKLSRVIYDDELLLLSSLRRRAHETTYGFCSELAYISMFPRMMLTFSSLLRPVVTSFRVGLAETLQAVGPTFLQGRESFSIN